MILGPRHRFGLFLLLVTLLASAGEARAQASVRLAFGVCPTLDAGRVRSIVGAEIGELLDAEDGFVEGEDVRTEVSVACDESIATLTARDAQTNQGLVRVVQLETVHPIARERLVAIAVAELVAAMGIELVEPAPEPVPAPETAPEPMPEPAPEPEPVAEAQPAPQPRRWIAVSASAALDGAPIRGAYGATIRLDRGLREPFGVAVSLASDRSSAAHPLGTIRAMRLVAAADATIGLYRDRFALQGSLGVAVGIVRMHGIPSDAAETGGYAFVAPLVAPRASARACRWFGPRVFLSAALELSAIVVGADGYVFEQRFVSVRRGTITGQLGIGASF